MLSLIFFWHNTLYTVGISAIILFSPSFYSYVMMKHFFLLCIVMDLFINKRHGSHIHIKSYKYMICYQSVVFVYCLIYYL